MKKRAILSIMVIVGFILLLYIAKILFLGDKDTITLYGNVDIRSVNVSFRVGGRLENLFADEGDVVIAGQPLGQIEKKPFQYALDQVMASVRSSKARLSLLREGYREEEIAVARSQLAEASANAAFAKVNAERLQNLSKSRAVSPNEADHAKALRDAALATLQSAKDKLRQYEVGSREQDTIQAEAALALAEAQKNQAELELKDTTLVSPSNGTIMTRVNEPGTMLAPGSTVFVLSLTRPVWVRAYVDEINLSKAVSGKIVQIFIDGRPNKPYRGKIGFVSPTSEFTPKAVQTTELRPELVYRLRIIIEDPDDMLRQGMPVTIQFQDS